MFYGRSLNEKGMLAQLRDAFNHRNATTNVMTSFNSVENLMRFVKEAHVVYLAMSLLEMESMQDCPRSSDPRFTKAERQNYLEDICYRIVDTVWLLPGYNEVSTVIDAEVEGIDDNWWICGEGKYMLQFLNFREIEIEIMIFY